MIVIDASAMVEALIGHDVDDDLLTVLSGDISAPHLLDLEVLSVLRGLELGHKIDPPRADAARANYFDLSIERHETGPLADRIWQLRKQFTCYDAAYLALAEALVVPLHTCDAKLLARSHRADLQLHGHTH